MRKRHQLAWIMFMLLCAVATLRAQHPEATLIAATPLMAARAP